MLEPGKSFSREDEVDVVGARPVTFRLGFIRPQKDPSRRALHRFQTHSFLEQCIDASVARTCQQVWGWARGMDLASGLSTATRRSESFDHKKQAIGDDGLLHEGVVLVNSMRTTSSGVSALE